jgi:hypothetical protein
VTAQGKARDDGSPRDVELELVTMFMTFSEVSHGTSGTNNPMLMNTINGHIFGNLRGLKMHHGGNSSMVRAGNGGREGPGTPPTGMGKA